MNITTIVISYTLKQIVLKWPDKSRKHVTFHIFTRKMVGITKATLTPEQYARRNQQLAIRSIVDIGLFP
jgi:hypothetical protein